MILVRIKATAKQQIEDGMVVDHIPAGLEVENMNLSKGPEASEFTVDGINLGAALTDARVNLETAMTDARIKHKEYRDDRFVAAVRLSAEPVHLFYMLRVVTPGRFNVPGTFAEDMYRPEIRAYGAAQDAITIADPRSGGK